MLFTLGVATDVLDVVGRPIPTLHAGHLMITSTTSIYGVSINLLVAKQRPTNHDIESVYQVLYHIYYIFCLLLGNQNLKAHISDQSRGGKGHHRVGRLATDNKYVSCNYTMCVNICSILVFSHLVLQLLHI